MRIRAFTAILASLSISGCASTMRYAFDDSPLPCERTGYIYGGVRIDGMLIKEGFSSDEDGSAFLAAFGIIDMPFSAVLDTILLPLSVPMEMKYRKQCEEEKEAEDVSV